MIYFYINLRCYQDRLNLNSQVILYYHHKYYNKVHNKFCLSIIKYKKDIKYKIVNNIYYKLIYNRT